MINDKVDIKSLTIEELTTLLVKMGFPKYRATQVFQWIHEKLVNDFAEMKNLPKTMIEKLQEECVLTAISVKDRQESKIDGTQKYLFELSDGNFVESVFMRYKFGNSVCISSQVGCRMGCRFCASTLDGLERGLKASEMLEQIYTMHRMTGERISHVVVMGTGEPLDNYEELVHFVKLISSSQGLNIGQRNITVSTCGIVPKMYELAEEHFQITLALSLHATTDEKRRRIMPIAEKYSIDELMEACRNYFDKTGRQITFEYSLIKGVNDSFEDADELCALAGPLRAHVNLIPVNPVKEREYVQTAAQAVVAFKNKLEKRKINVTIRRELGRDIDGACGQLRRRHLVAQ